ncbi:MAG: WD40-repeat-containing domain protein, partial [Benniella sp.]
RVHDMELGEKSDMKWHRNVIRRIVYSPNGRLIASASDDPSVRLWDLETGPLKHNFTGHGDTGFSVVCFSKGDQIVNQAGDVLAPGSRGRTVRLWDGATVQCRAVVQNFQGTIRSVAWS